MKKRIYTTMGYVSMFILCLLIVIACEVFILYLSVFNWHRKDQLWAIITMNLLGLFCVGLMIYYTFYFFQWANIDEKGIQIKCLFGKIQYRTWEEIRLIKEGYLPLSVKGGFVLKYFIFIDGREDVKIMNGVTRKKTYIMIPSNKKNEEIIKMFYSKEIEKIPEKE